MAGRGVAESLTSKGINRLLPATTRSTSEPAAMRQKYTWGFLAPVADGFNDFGEHRGFEDGSAHGPRGGVFRVLEAVQVAKGAHFRKIDLVRLDHDQALAHFGKVRTQNDNMKGGLQDRQEGFGVVGGDAQFSGQFRQIKKLGAPCGQSPQEILEQSEVADLPQGTHVAFQIGLEIAGMPERNIQIRL